MFELYQGDDVPFAESSADTTRSGNSPVISTGSIEVETYEVPAPEQLGWKGPSPDAPHRRRKRDRFRRFMKKIPEILRSNSA